MHRCGLIHKISNQKLLVLHNWRWESVEKENSVLQKTCTKYYHLCLQFDITNLGDDGSDTIELQGKIKRSQRIKALWDFELVFGAVTSIACSAANTYDGVEIVTSRARAMGTNTCKKDPNWNTFWAICFNAYILAWFTCWGGIFRLASNCRSHGFCECV